MLDEIEGNYPAEGMAKIQERCRPDYEAQIKGLRLKLTKSETLKNSVIFYLDGRKAKRQLAEMLGELVTECLFYEKRIEELIEQQASDPEK